MRPHRFAASLGLLVAFAASPAHAVDDAVRAQLAWSATDSSAIDLGAPGVSSLYIVLTGGVESFKGAEFDLAWTPAGDGGACFPAPALTFPQASDCTYLNRGTTAPVIPINEPGRLQAAWGNSASNDECSAGAIVTIDIDFTGCAPEGREFVLRSLQILDSTNTIHAVTSLGVAATVLGGINHPPEIKPIPGFSWGAGIELTVPLEAHDSDADPLTFSLASIDPAPTGAPPVVSTDSPTTGTLSWTPALADTGVAFTITVQADDGNGGFATEPFVVTVVGNRDPRIRHIPDKTAFEGAVLWVPIGGIDPDGDAMTFGFAGIQPLPPSGILPTVTDSTTTIGVMRWTPAAGDAGVYRLGLTVADGRGGSGSEVFRVTVLPRNNPPEIRPQPDTSIAEAVISSITLRASDPDSGDTANLRWGLLSPLPPWARLPSDVGPEISLELKPGYESADSLGSAGVGRDSIAFVVRDRRRALGGLSDTIRFVLTIDDVNRAPSIDPLLKRTVDVGSELAVLITAHDADGDPVNVDFVSVIPAPPSGTLPAVSDSTPGVAVLIWTPETQDAGSYTITVSADDGRGGQTTSSFLVDVIVPGANSPPFLQDVVPQTASVGVLLTVGLQAGDADGDPLHFGFVSSSPTPPSGILPTVTDLTSTTGRFQWTPGAKDAGQTFTMTVQATDTEGAADSTSFTVAVLPLVNNQFARAQLSWSATDFGLVDLTTPGAQNNLFIDMTEGVASFKGAEFDITWNPPGNGVDCRAQIGVFYKTSSGTSCTYLNRGSAVPVVTADEPGHLHVAWANTTALTSCTAGAIVQIAFEFDGEECVDPSTTFTLNSLALLDLNNVTWNLPALNRGVPATVLGGVTAGVSKGGRSSLPHVTAALTTALRVAPTLVASGARVAYTIEHDAPVDVAVFASDGRRVRTLDAGNKAAGEHDIAWDGRGDDATPLARGVYYVRAVLGDRRFAERVVLLR